MRVRVRQSITALAHLRAAVLYIVDISEQCGFTIAQQVRRLPLACVLYWFMPGGGWRSSWPCPSLWCTV